MKKFAKLFARSLEEKELQDLLFEPIFTDADNVDENTDAD
jgi:hypothetical protein